MKSKAVLFSGVILVIVCLICTRALNNKSSVDIKTSQREAAKVAVNYLQMYNTMCTKDNYSNYVEEFKSMCTEEFYYRTYVQNNAATGGLTEDMVGYNLNIDSTVCEINEANTGYKVMIYEIETYGDYKYPHTVIVDLTRDLKIKDFQKINHRFN